MRIKSIALSDYKPIVNIQIDNMGSTIVIAGANGSGKTRLKQAIVGTLQGNALMDMTIQSTRPEEEDAKYFGGQELVVRKGQKNAVLNNYINSRKFGAGRYVGSLVQIDSDRSVQALKYSPVNWLGGDPDDKEAPGSYYFGAFSNRWQDFITYIHQKSAAMDKKIAEEMKAHPDKRGHEILNNNPNPFDKYKKIFSETLEGKELLDIDPAQPREFRYRDSSGQELNFSTLSSGEQEVIKVLFDVARKDIRHSVIIVDEPELHLHPTLTFKLIESLKNIGEHTNQFIFLTHSPDIISTYYSTGDVYFIDMVQNGSNQAHRLSDLANEHQELLPLIGQNLGLFAVGKKLVFVEGEDSSIDRLTYQKIAQTVDPELRVIPAGSVFNVMTLGSIEQQIRKSIFGIELYMIRDRDGLTLSNVQALEKNGRIRCLKRRHIENYFLDSEILYAVAERLYITKAIPSITREVIERKVRAIAEESLGFNLIKNIREHLMMNHSLKAPSIRSLEKKQLSDIQTELTQAVILSVTELSSDLDEAKVRTWIANEESRLRKCLTDGSWITEFQGKYIFSKLCADLLHEDQIRLRHAYTDVAMSEKPEAIQEITDIFKGM